MLENVAVDVQVVLKIALRVVCSAFQKCSVQLCEYWLLKDSILKAAVSVRFLMLPHSR